VNSALERRHLATRSAESRLDRSATPARRQPHGITFLHPLAPSNGGEQDRASEQASSCPPELRRTDQCRLVNSLEAQSTIHCRDLLRQFRRPRRCRSASYPHAGRLRLQLFNPSAWASPTHPHPFLPEERSNPRQSPIFTRQPQSRSSPPAALSQAVRRSSADRVSLLRHLVPTASAIKAPNSWRGERTRHASELTLIKLHRLSAGRESE
jgi:hypothetical protein